MADEPTGVHMTAPDGAHDEPTAIRHPWWSQAHRPLHWFAFNETACHRYLPDGYSTPERVPLSQTAPEDRCRTCWPTTKETD